RATSCGALRRLPPQTLSRASHAHRGANSLITRRPSVSARSVLERSRRRGAPRWSAGELLQADQEEIMRTANVLLGASALLSAALVAGLVDAQTRGDRFRVRGTTDNE